jgi:hypothetical protein
VTLFPEFNEQGDLPVGIYKATLREVLEHFGKQNFQRRLVAQRLVKIYDLVNNTGRLARFVVYGSFITNKQYPKDVDVFLLMEDDFDKSLLKDEAARIFDHLETENNLGASVFWMRRESTLGDEQGFIEFWQIKSDNTTRRGIVEIISHD